MWNFTERYNYFLVLFVRRFHCSLKNEWSSYIKPIRYNGTILDLGYFCS